MAESEAKPFVAEDVRFTSKRDTLYAFLLDWPTGEIAIRSLGRAQLSGARVQRLTLLGGGPVEFRHDGDALRLTLPAAGRRFVPALRVDGSGLAA
jgi:alpha-L-fucosidase